MTNRELLRTSKQLLSEVEKQRLYLLRVEGTPMPCAACREPINLFDATGIDLDAYDFGKTSYAFRCPHCAAELEQVVPFVTGGQLWHWELKYRWLQERLRKAKAFDQQAVSDDSSRAN